MDRPTISVRWSGRWFVSRWIFSIIHFTVWNNFHSLLTYSCKISIKPRPLFIYCISNIHECECECECDANECQAIKMTCCFVAAANAVMLPIRSSCCVFPMFSNKLSKNKLKPKKKLQRINDYFWLWKIFTLENPFLEIILSSESVLEIEFWINMQK